MQEVEGICEHAFQKHQTTLVNRKRKWEWPVIKSWPLKKLVIYPGVLKGGWGFKGPVFIMYTCHTTFSKINWAYSLRSLYLGKYKITSKSLLFQTILPNCAAEFHTCSKDRIPFICFLTPGVRWYWWWKPMKLALPTKLVKQNNSEPRDGQRKSISTFL